MELCIGHRRASGDKRVGEIMEIQYTYLWNWSGIYVVGWESTPSIRNKLTLWDKTRFSLLSFHCWVAQNNPKCRGTPVWSLNSLRHKGDSHSTAHRNTCIKLKETATSSPEKNKLGGSLRPVKVVLHRKATKLRQAYHLSLSSPW